MKKKNEKRKIKKKNLKNNKMNNKSLIYIYRFISHI